MISNLSRGVLSAETEARLLRLWNNRVLRDNIGNRPADADKLAAQIRQQIEMAREVVV